MNIVGGYGSSDEESDSVSKQLLVTVSTAKKDHIIPKFDSTNHYSEYTQITEKSIPTEVNEAIEDTSELSTKKRTFGGTLEKIHFDSALFKTRSNQDKARAKRLKKQRKKNDGEYIGPWADYEDDEVKQENTEKSLTTENNEETETKEEEELVEQDEEEGESEEENATSKFFGSSLTDYLGRSYIHVPKDLKINLTKRPGSQVCYAPKKVIHTFPGHAKGINKLEYFPRSGHLLLSAGNDNVIRLWDLYHKRELLREFYGHTKAVKDISFSKDGTKFLSCGYDKKINLWNTETGEVEKTIAVKAIPNVIKFNPNNENEFIVGLSNHDIDHYDLTILNFEIPIQTYDHHLGAINSLTIIEDGKRFMSTADDKTVRFWDWQINIPVKFISDPSQHSMPTAALYPDGNFIALQTMDNSIQVIQGHGKYRYNKNKLFKGHNVAGYGIGIDISPDGRVMSSGDSHGFVYFWDWKTSKLIRKIKLNDKVVSSIRYHPQEVSRVVAGGISGEIYIIE